MEDLELITEEAGRQIEAAEDLKTLDDARVALLGKKGRITGLLKSLGGMEPDQRKSFGQAVNQARDTLQSAIAARREALEREALNEKIAAERIDVTLPGRGQQRGGLHPVTRATQRAIEIFGSLGFEVAHGPEVEDDYHNFEALNFPPNHPARTDHDTFYFGDGRLLRTHTSPVQIRTMKKTEPPYRIIAPGKVYRSDSDQTHTPMFHQLEGLMVGEGVTMADLKGALQAFVNAYFERDLEMRFRPGYFPFTEPSAEVDIVWDKGDGSAPGWLEILGSGMVHPNVLKACDLDPERYTGWAFGMGLDRLAMLRYDIKDIRLFFENDLRFLSQFH